MSRNKLIVFCTVKDMDEGEKIAKALVTEHLAACVNIISGVRSIYHWKGKIEDESEVMLLIKTSADLFASLEEQIHKLHSYDVPEIIAIEP
jgi:periplasmic divalent cation tolerance protein